MRLASKMPGAFFIVVYPCLGLLVAEITVVETLEALAVTSLVFCHLVNGVVDSVEVLSLGILGDTHLVGVATGLCVHSLLQVGLEIGRAHV